jgi:hypothetical protein
LRGGRGEIYGGAGDIRAARKRGKRKEVKAEKQREQRGRKEEEKKEERHSGEWRSRGLAAGDGGD